MGVCVCVCVCVYVCYVTNSSLMHLIFYRRRMRDQRPAMIQTPRYLSIYIIFTKVDVSLYNFQGMLLLETRFKRSIEDERL